MSRPQTLQQWLSPFLSASQRSSNSEWDWESALPKLVVDSREASSESWFVSMPTELSKRQAYAQKALEAGAITVIPGGWEGKQWQSSRVLVLDNLDHKVGALLASYWGNPSQQMRIIGITGTNGKSSTAFFTAQILSALGQASGVMGTLGYGPIHRLKQGIHTTPDAFRLQQELADFHASDLQSVAMEVSSHSLEQHRVDGVAFHTAVFTNLTRDHLDYHGTMEAYGAAKAKLFQWPGLKRAVFNLDDLFSVSLMKQQKAGEILSYSLQNTAADFHLLEWKANDQGMSGVMHTPFGECAFQVPLIGVFNLSNVLAAIAATAPLMNSKTDLEQALLSIQAVSGRMELLIPSAQQSSFPKVVIDYAHTPDALEQAIKALKPHVPGKLHLVFGCGGDRDQGKRAAMGEIAAQHADVLWVTSDNPRTEVPENILSDIMAGVEKRSAVDCPEKHQEIDRGKAIAKALCHAESRDWVLIAGKGHEDYQEIQGRRIPFSDRQQALDLIGQNF